PQILSCMTTMAPIGTSWRSAAAAASFRQWPIQTERRRASVGEIFLEVTLDETSAFQINLKLGVDESHGTLTGVVLADLQGLQFEKTAGAGKAQRPRSLDRQHSGALVVVAVDDVGVGGEFSNDGCGT